MFRFWWSLSVGLKWITGHIMQTNLVSVSWRCKMLYWIKQNSQLKWISSLNRDEIFFHDDFNSISKKDFSDDNWSLSYLTNRPVLITFSYDDFIAPRDSLRFWTLQWTEKIEHYRNDWTWCHWLNNLKSS